MSNAAIFLAMMVVAAWIVWGFRLFVDLQNDACRSSPSET